MQLNPGSPMSGLLARLNPKLATRRSSNSRGRHWFYPSILTVVTQAGLCMPTEDPLLNLFAHHAAEIEASRPASA
jgi:hypothetical protein